MSKSYQQSNNDLPLAGGWRGAKELERIVQQVVRTNLFGYLS